MGMGAEVNLSKNRDMHWSQSIVLKKLIIAVGYPRHFMLSSNQPIMALGKVLVISRKMMVLTFFLHHAFLTLWTR